MGTPNIDIRKQISVLRATVLSVTACIHRLGSPELWRIVLTLVSSVTTWYGMTLLYNAFGTSRAGSSMGWLSFIIPIAVAGALHAAIYWALGRWSKTRRYHYLVVALPLQVLAVSASYGTHWTHMQGGSVTTAAYNSDQAMIYQGLVEFVHSYRTLKDQTEALSEHSKTEASIEAKNGTSCGVQAGRGRGPRYRLRMADRDTYQTFNAEIARRMKQLEALLGEAGAISASNADDAMRKLGKLRQIVAEAESFEDDPLLTSLRDTAQARIIAGEGQMKDSNVSHGSTQAFTCPDQVLEQHLRAVIAAVGHLRPLPEPTVADARDPHVGFVLALRRVFDSIWGIHMLPRTKAQLAHQRVSLLHQGPGTAEGIQPGDIPPLVMAVVIEASLTLLFWISRGALPLHPGLASLSAYLVRPRDQVIHQLWARIQPDISTTNLYEVLQRNTCHQKRHELIIFPLYSENPETHTLCQLMELLCAVKLAKKYYTGQALFRLLTLGLPEARKLELRSGGPLRVYRMRDEDYTAVLLSTTGAAPAKGPAPPRDSDTGSTSVHIVGSGNEEKNAA